jgi:hypothetical protein
MQTSPIMHIVSLHSNHTYIHVHVQVVFKHDLITGSIYVVNDCHILYSAAYAMILSNVCRYDTLITAS